MLGNLNFLRASTPMHTQTYIHTYSNTCTCTYYVHTHALTYACIYVIISPWRIRIFLGRRRLYIHRHIYIHTWIHAHVHMRGSCHVYTYVCMYACIHISMTRVNRATFVLSQLCLICIYACSLRMLLCTYVSIFQWQESTAPLLSCYSRLSYKIYGTQL